MEQAADPPSSEAAGSLDFVCPRCGAEVHERLWGPCASCRTELRATLGGAARNVVAEEYVPKMNVVPNSVAASRNDS
jgi:hypothetical protein